MLARSQALRRAAIRRSYAATGPSAEVVEAVLNRANYSCERCSSMVGDRRGIDWSVQHRRPRKDGGTKRPDTNSPANLMILCGSGTTKCHGHVETNRAEAQDCGWLVPEGADPAEYAVLIDNGARWVYLTHSAEYAENPEGGE